LRVGNCPQRAVQTRKKCDDEPDPESLRSPIPLSSKNMVPHHLGTNNTHNFLSKTLGSHPEVRTGILSFHGNPPAHAHAPVQWQFSCQTTDRRGVHTCTFIVCMKVHRFLWSASVHVRVCICLLPVCICIAHLRPWAHNLVHTPAWRFSTGPAKAEMCLFWSHTSCKSPLPCVCIFCFQHPCLTASLVVWVWAPRYSARGRSCLANAWLAPLPISITS